MLTDKEKIRYSRQLMLHDFDQSQQLKLKQSTVLLVGIGGLGSPAAFYLAASGIGKLLLVDHDVVELSNLQRQILFKVNHLGQQKVSAAAKTLFALNNQIAIECFDDGFTQQNGEAMVRAADIVLDCSDNFNTRYLVNRFAHKHRVPLISGAAMQYQGQLGYFPNNQKNTPCYQCLFPNTAQNSSESCATVGVLSPLLGIIGSMQATMAINSLISGLRQAEFIQLDAKTLQQTKVKLIADPSCPICTGDNANIK